MAMGVGALDISDVGLCRDNKQKVYSMEIFSSRRQENQVFREKSGVLLVFFSKFLKNPSIFTKIRYFERFSSKLVKKPSEHCTF